MVWPFVAESARSVGEVVMSSEGGVVGSVVPDVSKPPCVFIL